MNPFELLLCCFIDLPLQLALGHSQTPKIEARLLSHTHQIDNKLHLEIENISEISFQLEPNATIFFSHNSKALLPLGLTTEQLLLLPFTPTKIAAQISNEKDIQSIEFRLVGKNPLRVKLKQQHG